MENKEKHLGSVRREEAPKSRKRDEEKEPFSWKKEILSWIQILAAAAVIAYVLTTYIIANSTVPTGSMENTIMSHSRVIGSRLSYIKDDPERGEADLQLSFLEFFEIMARSMLKLALK